MRVLHGRSLRGYATVAYNAYQAQTDREIPIVIIEPLAAPEA
ncbi:hypothetical protein [Streptomyces sp. WM6378]|nr:hypothetical protein [Streptomyces sp. WM6378]